MHEAPLSAWPTSAQSLSRPGAGEDSGQPARKLRLDDRPAEVKSFSPDIVIPQLLVLVTLDWASAARRALWRQSPSAWPLPSVGRASGL